MKPSIKLAIVAAVAGLVAVALFAKRTNRETVASAPDPGPSNVQPAAAAAPIPRLVDLGAGKCIPCKMMAPILEQLKKEYAGKLAVEFIDVWEKPEASEKYNINVIPTQIFYGADGKELWRHEGFLGKEDILAKWGELGVSLKRQASAGG